MKKCWRILSLALFWTKQLCCYPEHPGHSQANWPYKRSGWTVTTAGVVGLLRPGEVISTSLVVKVLMAMIEIAIIRIKATVYTRLRFCGCSIWNLLLNGRFALLGLTVWAVSADTLLNLDCERTILVSASDINIVTISIAINTPLWSNICAIFW